MSGHVIIPVIGFLVAGLTAFYMFRVVILAFLATIRMQPAFRIFVNRRW